MTEVGLIPEDWDTPLLGDVIKSTQVGGNYRNSERESKWPLIKMGNLGRGRINLDKLEFVDSSEGPATRDRLERNDVLFNTRNTLDLVGKVAIWRDELPEAYFNSNIMRLAFDETRIASKCFMSYLLNTRQAVQSLREIAIGTTSVAAIYGRDLARVMVALPTKAGQLAIAEVLSDVDDLIGSLEKLIAKKRLIKQGAMQELLTGRRRLPGFDGKWEVRHLKDVADTNAEGLARDTRPDWSFNYIALEDVDVGCLNGYTEHVLRSAPSRARRRLRQGDVLVATVRPNLMSHYLFRFGTGNWVGSTGFCVVRCRELVSEPTYVYFHMFGDTVSRQIRASLAGSNYPAISASDVAALEIPFPDYVEQVAIGEVLVDIDNEIASLEALLAKYQVVKQGMMQQLLTGRIRLA
jgi:type I restriction enzyme S subunit